MSDESNPRTGEDDLWRRALKQLTLWTTKRHQMSPADAEETVQEAIRLFLTQGGKADPTDPDALLRVLGSNVNGIAVNRRRKKAELAVHLTDDGEPTEPEDPPDAEKRIIDAEIARKAVSALLERAAHDERVTALVMRQSDGVEEPAAQAQALGCDIREVYNARRRLKKHVEVIQQLMEAW